MAKIRTLKRKLSILQKKEVRIFKKYFQNKNKKLTRIEKINFEYNRIASYRKYTKLRFRLLNYKK